MERVSKKRMKVRLTGPIFLKVQPLLDASERDPVATFTAVLALFTALLYRATAGLKASTDKLWKAGEEQMKLIEGNAAQQSRDLNASIAVARQAMISKLSEIRP